MDVGDTIYLIDYHFGTAIRVTETSVVRLTPSGQAVLSNGRRVKNGRIVGEQFSYSVNTGITVDEKDVAEARAEVAKRQFVTRLASVKWSAYPLETLDAVCQLLDSRRTEGTS